MMLRSARRAAAAGRAAGGARALSASVAAPSERVRSFRPSVFSEYTELANATGAVSLGQGFPDWPTPHFVKEAVRESVAGDFNQYTRSMGHPLLVQALAETYSPLFGRELDPLANFVVTDGATEAGFSAVQALVNPGDEVLMMEPFYDAYPAWVRMAGGEPRFVPMRQPASPAEGSAGWTVDFDAMEAAVTPRTRVMVLNNPHNPVGKVFTRDELERVADLARRHNLVVISDEVYEFLTYDGEEHTRIATLDGMWERTVTLCSAGKSFSCTGFKVGWVVASREVCAAVAAGHQWVSFCTATPLQHAVGLSLREASRGDYFDRLRAGFTAKRDRLHAALNEAGMQACLPQGGYFVLADYTGRFPEAEVPREKGDNVDYEAARHITRQLGVAPIPPSAFYSAEHAGEVSHLARFAFCKQDSVLDAAIAKLQS